MFCPLTLTNPWNGMYGGHQSVMIYFHCSPSVQLFSMPETNYSDMVNQGYNTMRLDRLLCYSMLSCH